SSSRLLAICCSPAHVRVLPSTFPRRRRPVYRLCFLRLAAGIAASDAVDRYQSPTGGQGEESPIRFSILPEARTGWRLTPLPPHSFADQCFHQIATTRGRLNWLASQYNSIIEVSRA